MTISSIWSLVNPHLAASVRARFGVKRPYQSPYIIVAVRLLALNFGGGVSASRRKAVRNPTNQDRSAVSMGSAVQSNNDRVQAVREVD